VAVSRNRYGVEKTVDTHKILISGTTGQNFMKLGGVIDICF
jgi:hypothetical protein